MEFSGIFNANIAFQFYQLTDSWSYSSFGNLKIEEWAYALALFIFMRNKNDPERKQHLSKTIKNDFKKYLRYMIENENEVFRFDEEKK